MNIYSPVLDDGFEYGSALSSIGDLNNDGVIDLAAGVPKDNDEGSSQGSLYIHFMNTDGSIDSTEEIDSATTNGPQLSDGDFYGSSVVNIGDLNDDGFDDLLVGAINDDTSGNDAGAAYIHFMSTDASLTTTVKIDGTTENGPVLGDTYRYGSSVASLGDLNDDDVPDVGVGSYLDSEQGVYEGAIYIHFLKEDGSIKSSIKIDSATSNGANTLEDNDFYGEAIANIGDLNEDGFIDIAVGASGYTNGGAVFIHFLKSYSFTSFKEDSRCHAESPEPTTWLKLEPHEKDGVKGMLLTWTQYIADKVSILIDDGTGNFPWKIDKTSNDGHEFLQNVAPYQEVKLEPLNDCEDGDDSAAISYNKYPNGWFSDMVGTNNSGGGAVLGAGTSQSSAAVPDTGQETILYSLIAATVVGLGLFYLLSGNSRKMAIKNFEGEFLDKL